MENFKPTHFIHAFKLANGAYCTSKLTKIELLDIVLKNAKHRKAKNISVFRIQAKPKKPAAVVVRDFTSLNLFNL